MLYRVEHYHHPDHVTYDQIGIETPMTEYKIEAESTKDAAVMAHAYYSGYTGREESPVPFDRPGSMTYPSRTIKERLEDQIKYNGRRMDGGDVYAWKPQVKNLIIVYPEG